MTAAKEIPALQTRVGSLGLRNPIICGSGEHVMTVSGIRAALASGSAGVIAKSINESPAAAEQLGKADYAMLEGGGAVLQHSLFCRSGLAGHEPGRWFQELAHLDEQASLDGQFVAASIVLAEPSAAAQLAKLANDSGLRVLELNIGAPHGAEAAKGAITIESDPERVATVVAQVRAQFDGALWIKLAGAISDPGDVCFAARRAGADAVVMSGRVMGMWPDVDSLRPLLGTAAAYGGQWALPITCRSLSLARRRLGAAVPLIGTNGARTGLDVARLLLAGASAVEMTSAVFLGGFQALTAAINELDTWLGTKSLSVDAVVGRAADALQSYGEQAPHVGRWRDFVPVETCG